ncbi:MAG: UvrB/UvrC motif-containing protein, partial [Planctomycetaceae bacterium]
RLGCSDCYTAFREELLPLLENIHGDIQHVGKAPRRAPLDSRRRQDLIRLRSELKTAISEESYERAAELRDQIQQLERDLQGEGRP